MITFQGLRIDPEVAVLLYIDSKVVFSKYYDIWRSEEIQRSPKL